MARHILFGDEIHAVLQARDQHNVCGLVVGDEIRERNRPVHIGDRGVPNAAEVAINPPDGFFHLPTRHLVVLNALARRRRHLHERGGLGVQRTGFQEFLVRFEALEDSLGVVQPVDAEDQGFRIAQLRADLLCISVLRGGGHRLGVDGDREYTDADGATVGCSDCGGDLPHTGFAADGQAIRLARTGGCEPADVAGELEEVGCVVDGVEADHVCAQQAADQLFTPRQLAEQLRRRERNVQEEPNFQVRAHLPQNAGQQLQLVVLHPHCCTFGCAPGHLHREARVDVAVGHPPVAVEDRRHDKVVVKGPQCGVGEPFVVFAVIPLGQAHRDQCDAFVSHERVGDGGCRGPFGCRAGPADPCAFVFFEDGFQRRDQATRAWFEVLGAVGVDLNIDG